MLEEGSAAQRHAAALVLLSISGRHDSLTLLRPYVPEILACLGGPDLSLAKIAILVLFNLIPEPVDVMLPDVIVHVNDRNANEEIRTALVGVLTAYAPNDPKVVAAITGFMREEHSVGARDSAVSSIANGLLSRHRYSTDLVQLIVDAAENDAQTRFTSIQALGRLGPRAHDVALPVLSRVARDDHERPDVRKMAESAIDMIQQSEPDIPQQTLPTAAAGKLREAMIAFENREFAAARSLFREVLVTAPNDEQLQEMEAGCSVRLKDYPAAASSFKRALELRPDAAHLLSALLMVYTLGEHTSERDAVLDHIRILQSEGRLPNNFPIMLDSFRVDDRRVEVTGLSIIAGRADSLTQRYDFHVLDLADRELLDLALESNQIDQNEWALTYQRDFAGGKRVFSLDDYGGHSPDPQATYTFYEGEPEYGRVREDVRQVLLGNLEPMNPDQYGRRPTPK
jgi:tetratricopeptide (TPR) repeat protein